MPKPDPNSARGRNEASHAKVTRIEELRQAKIDPPMPENPAPHLIDRLVEMGITEGEMSAKPLSWGEIVAWQTATMIRLAPWEARLIRRLSAAYVAESRAAESENCPPPWHVGPIRQLVETEEARLMAVLG